MKTTFKRIVTYTPGHASTHFVSMYEGGLVLDVIKEQINGAYTVSLITLEDTRKLVGVREFRMFALGSPIQDFTDTTTRYWYIGTIEYEVSGSSYPVYYTLWEVKT